MANRSYGELISQAVLNFEFFRGTIQNLGTFSLTMTSIGTEKFTKYNGITVLSSMLNGIGPYSTSSALQPLDLLSTITIESVFANVSPKTYQSYDGTVAYSLRIRNAGAGIELWHAVTTTTGASYCALVYYDAGGSIVRQVYYDTSTLNQQNKLNHIIISATAGLNAQIYLNGASLTPLYLYTGTVANASTYVKFGGCGGGQTGNATIALARAWQDTIDSNEARILYENYINLTVPSKV